MRRIFRGTADNLAVERVPDPALDNHGYGLVTFITDHCAFQYTTGHFTYSLAFFLAALAALAASTVRFATVDLAALTTGFLPDFTSLSSVLIFAISRRTTRMREVSSILPTDFWNRKLNCSLRKSSRLCFNSSADFTLKSAVFILFTLIARYETHFYLQLGGSQRESLLRHFTRHAIKFKHDFARFDAADIKFRRTLSAAHPHLERFLGDRHIRKNTDPEASLALDATADR